MKILFVHGLASSGAYKLADMLRINIKADVIAPDVPPDPDRALEMLTELCDSERPDIVAGLSWGGFLSLRLPSRIPVAVINPDLHISRLLRSRIGWMEYLSPRRDGEKGFEISPELCARYEAMEREGIPSRERLIGLFAASDELVNCGDEFETLFPGRRIKYPGKHLPTFPEVKKYIAPALLAYVEGHPEVFNLGVVDGVQLPDGSGED